MEAPEADVAKIITQTLASGRGRADIESELREKGYDLDTFAHHIEAGLKQYAIRKRTNGQVLIAIGALICFASCVITLALGSIGNSAITLIGITSLGIIVLFAGLTKIF